MISCMILILFQCTQNGLTYSKLQNGEVFNCTKLEMFFSGFPKIVGMRHFPSLNTLMLVDQPISKIEGISTLQLLKELWISESKISVIIILMFMWMIPKNQFNVKVNKVLRQQDNYKLTV